MLKHVRNNGTLNWRTLFYLIGITLYVYHENIPEKKYFIVFIQIMHIFMFEMVSFDH